MFGDELMESINIRLFRNEDYEEYKKLFFQVYKKELNYEFFKYKNNENPFLKGEPIIYLITDKNKIIGANSFFPIEIIIDGKTYLGVQSGDTMVLSDYRGKGLFKKVISYAIKDLSDNGYDFIIGFANNNSYPGFIKLGFNRVDELKVYKTIINFKCINKVKRSSILKLIAKTNLPNFALNIGRKNSKLKDVYINEITNIDEEVCKFINKLTSDIKINKNLQYNKWKYTDNNKLKLAVHNKNTNEIMAFFVLNRCQDNCMSILEHYIADESIYNKIFNTLEIYLYNNYNVSLITVWRLNNSKLDFMDKSLLYSKSLPGIYYIYKNLNNISDIDKLSMLNIVNGDADTV
ncbi:MAG: GNAT family N-acetyltransferase [Clostridium sulfidigenes]|uniref:GNAT family N-acetyltransferase n=1 Tax=Clostridium sulfidigenes TaxID=318464 RepID=A0A927ZJE2_9CLOT|nr:GNAT family N-acetyltransferase [Clostridium sulfidigenes]